MAQWKGDRIAGPTTFVGEGNELTDLGGIAQKITKAQCMDQRRTMLNFAINADDCGFFKGFDVFATPNQWHQTGNHFLAQNGGTGMDLRRQIFNNRPTHGFSAQLQQLPCETEFR